MSVDLRKLDLHPEGAEMVNALGQKTRLPGVTQFGLFKRALSHPEGWRLLCEPVVDEIRKVATEGGWPATEPIIYRIARHAGPWNAFGITDPWSYTPAQITLFSQQLANKGVIIDWTGCDYQACFSGLDGPRGVHQHHNNFAFAILGVRNGIWNVSNEPFKNGIDSFQAVPPPWAPKVWYSGWYDDPRDPVAVNLHTDRSDEGSIHKWVGKAHESAPYMWKHGKIVFYDEPNGGDEVTIPGKRSNVPAYFRTLGSVLTMVNAVYFHSTAGLTSDGMGNDFDTRWPITRQCMREFFSGAAGARLS